VDAVRNVNPQGAILTKLFRLPDSEADTAATWQQFAMSIVVDLLIMACFIAHEVMGWETRSKRQQEQITENPGGSAAAGAPPGEETGQCRDAGVEQSAQRMPSRTRPQ
jgi:hypothetical protein